jgi:hypothetical protein
MARVQVGRWLLMLLGHSDIQVLAPFRIIIQRETLVVTNTA